MTRILVVEDESSFSEALEFLLGKEGFTVVTAENGSEALKKFDQGGIDLVLLDLMLPEVSGTEVCRQIRAKSGADDYVTKPYSTRELVARINAVLRRNGGDGIVSDSGVLTVQNIRMDIDRHQVSINGIPASLPLKEFELLEFLMRNAGRVLTRMQLIDRVWGSDYVGDTKTLDVHVKRLRAKIEEDPANPKIIQTVRGLGYKMEL
ncbi:MAG: DNA-binding response regulator [Actinobacteria bacterium]|nr:DNA-binding response regulator [Actinomycetota bacterium]